VLELAAEHALALAAEPLIEHGGIDLAKVGVELQVARGQVVGFQTRMVADPFTPGPTTNRLEPEPWSVP
jgi:hypothetical protein